MVPRLCVVLATLVSLAFGVQCSGQEADSFQPLFNGKDLTGWVLVNTPPETWTVQDGMLVCSGQPIGEIRTDRMYQNFILEVEWRHLVPRGNAGIFVWADDITAKGVPFHRSIEVQVLENAYGNSPHHTTHGDIFPIHGAKMTPVNGRGGSRAFPVEEHSRPSPEWNHYRIECNDGAIRLAVNGHVVTQGTDCSPRKGYLCLESEGGVVHYRNLRIRELPETAVAPEHIAVQNRGYRSIYSGLDLRGWKAGPKGSTLWHARDWTLVFDGTADAAAETELTHEETLSEHDILFDIKPAKGFRGLGICGVTLDTAEFSIGEWQRVHAKVSQGRISIDIDDRPAGNHSPEGSPAELTLNPSGPAEFANLYLRAIQP